VFLNTDWLNDPNVVVRQSGGLELVMLHFVCQLLSWMFMNIVVSLIWVVLRFVGELLS
jgi:hypothetical protein